MSIDNSDNVQPDVSHQSGQPNDASAQQGGLTARDVMPNAPKTSAPPADTPGASGATTKAAPSMTDVAASSLERSLGGGGAAAEQINLGDAIYAPPTKGYSGAARELTVQANLTEGRVTVTNMSLQVDGKEIRGPVSYTKTGQEFIIDQSTHEKYKIIPPSDSMPNGGVVPVSRGRAEGEPVAIQASKVVPGLGDGGSYGAFSRPPMGDANQQRQQPAPQQGEGAAAQPAQPGQSSRPPQGDSAAAQPAQPSKQPNAGGDANATASQPHSGFNNLTPQQWQQFQNLQQQGAFATKPDGSFVRPDVAAGAAQFLGLSKNDLATISQLKNPSADQLQQTFQRADSPSAPGGPQSRPTDGQNIAAQSAGAPARPGDASAQQQQQQQGRPGDNTSPQQPMKLTPEQVNYLQQQFAQKPELLQQLVQSQDPRAQQLLAQLQQAGVQLPGGDRGGAPGPHGPQGLQGGDKVAASQQPGDKNTPLPPSDNAAAKGAQDAHMARVGSQQLDALLAAQLAQNNTRQSLADSLAMAQAGKLPMDGGQQQRQVQDLVRAIGPENMMQLRQLILENQGNSPLRLEGKFDPQTQANMRQLLELMLIQKPGELHTPQNNVDRFMDILRSSDRLNLLTKAQDGDASRTSLMELSRMVRDFNATNGLESGKGAISLRDILSRSLDERNSVNPERRDFNVRTQDEATMKALMALVGRRDIETRADGIVRTEGLMTRPDNKLDARHDNRSEGPGVGRPEDALRNIMTRQLADKQEGTTPAERNIQNAIAGATDKNLAATNDKVPEAKRPDAKDDDKQLEDERKARKPEHKPDEPTADAAAILAAMNAKKRKPEDDKDDKETIVSKDKKEPEKRQKYVVKPGDTLESIADKQLRDKLLAGLIFEINNETIPTRVVNGRKVAELVPKMVIWLPTSIDIREYRVRLLSKAGPMPTAQTQKFASAEDELSARFGENWNGDGEGGEKSGTTGGASLEEMEESARAAYQARRQHIESLLGPLSSHQETGRPKYVVRLGDSLKSIAMKHPSLNDVQMWKLLAEVNSLPDKVDEKGNPVATIKRGQILNLPSQEEIDEFKRRGAASPARPAKPTDKASVAGIELETRPCPTCGRVTFASAAICPACGGDFTADADAAQNQESLKTKARSPRRTASKLKPVSAVTAEAEPTAKASTPADAAPSKATTGGPATTRYNDNRNPEPEYHVATEFTETARLVQTGDPEKAAGEFKLRLELRHQDNWVPVVAYEIFEDLSLRHEHKPGGARKTIRIDLPPSAAIELAQNDLSSNWQSYCDKFIGTRAPD